MNTIYSITSQMIYRFDITPDTQIGHIRYQARAFKSLFGQCNIWARGHWSEPDGNAVFIDYRPCPVVKIGRKYLTVDLGHEGLVELSLADGTDRRLIFSNTEGV